MNQDIHAYRQKRDFSQTPEPQPRKGRSRKVAFFVIQRHEARRLHYDLRIEIDGVLKSWAVPKGFSYDPKDKHLAVRTEDHPLEYLGFAGVIPQGQYGAGLITIWDRGPFELLNGPWEQALDAGKIELRLRGARLRGEWHMVRLKDQREQWLLFKSRDRYAREHDEPPVALDLLHVPTAIMPWRLQRMEPGQVSPPFVDAQWLFEPLLPGRRIFAEKAGAEIRLRGLKSDVAQRAARVLAGLERLKADNALLDGVLVAFDDQQRPCRATLDAALRGKDAAEVQFYAFDLLYYDEWDLRQFPLAERKAALSAILPRPSAVVFVDHERGQAADLLVSAVALGLPGVMAKLASSTYQRGPSSAWRRIEVTSAPATPTRPLPSPAKRSQRISFTNRRKVLWPRLGYTKGDLIDYYEQVAEWLLPYLRDRPLSLNRFPNGIDGGSFFQKDAPAHTPRWIKTVVVASEHRDEASIRFVLCNNRDTLLYLANLAAIELHPWSSRTGSLASPDWAIFDLDPTTDEFLAVIQVARHLRDVLRDIGLRAYLKTSGSKGLHLYVPVAAGYSYDQVRMFCEGVARLVALERSDLATVERSKPRRDGKVYVDFLQNRRGQTVVAPYVVRPVPEACVSAPLAWDELTDDLRPNWFTVSSLAPRLARPVDPFLATLTDHQDLLPAVDRLRERTATLAPARKRRRGQVP